MDQMRFTTITDKYSSTVLASFFPDIWVFGCVTEIYISQVKEHAAKHWLKTGACIVSRLGQTTVKVFVHQTCPIFVTQCLKMVNLVGAKPAAVLKTQTHQRKIKLPVTIGPASSGPVTFATALESPQRKG